MINSSVELKDQLQKNREYMGQLLERNIIGSILYNMYRLVDTVAPNRWKKSIA